MKIPHKLALASSLLLIAGCAHHERQASYSEQRYSTYNPQGSSGSTWSSNPTSSANQNSNGGIGAQNAQVTQVQQQLMQDPALAPLVPNLQISSANGTLTISGTVPSEQEKQKIETIAKSATGVASINNQLRVSTQSSLNQQPAGGTSEQSSTTQLNGTQTSDTSPSPGKSAAEQAALDSSKSTDDQSLTPTSDSDSSRNYGSRDIRVQGATDADKTLGQQIAKQLKSDTTLIAGLSKIKINVDNGKVTLRGNVTSEDQKNKIASAIQKISGVSNVDDQLQVSTTGSQNESAQPSPSSAREGKADSTPPANEK